MSKQEKIDFILEVSPNMKKIIAFATDDQIDQLVEDTKKKMSYQIEKAQYEFV